MTVYFTFEGEKKKRTGVTDERKERTNESVPNESVRRSAIGVGRCCSWNERDSRYSARATTERAPATTNPFYCPCSCVCQDSKSRLSERHGHVERARSRHASCRSSSLSLLFSFDLPRAARTARTTPRRRGLSPFRSVEFFIPL